MLLSHLCQLSAKRVGDVSCKSLDRRSYSRAQAQAKKPSDDQRIWLAMCVGSRLEDECRAADRVSRQAQAEKASTELLSPSPGLQTPQVHSGGGRVPSS